MKRYPMILPLKQFTCGHETINMVSGEGIFVEDSEGKRYIDATSGLWNMPLGYNKLDLKNAIVKQLDSLQFINLLEFNNPTSLELAGLLLAITNNDFAKMLYTCSGSESVEAAIKLVRQYHRLKGNHSKYLVASFDLSYHGTYYGSLSASGIDQQFTDWYSPKVGGFNFLPTPRNEACTERDLEHLTQYFKTNGQATAGFILEPVIGSGGIVSISKEYISALKKLCDEYDVLLVFDEIASGFHRTGPMFAYEDLGVKPDILCLAKALSNGYMPLGAVLVNEKIVGEYLRNDAFFEHFSTQNGNPIACGAGIATITALQKQYDKSMINGKGQAINQALQEGLVGHKNVKEVRGKGLMVGIELVRDAQSSHTPILGFEQVLEIKRKLLDRGLIVYAFYSPGNTAGISLFPPYLVDERDCERITSKILDIFKKNIF